MARTAKILPSAAPRVCRGLGVQADCYLYDDINRQMGVDDNDYARWERRLKFLRPGVARIFLPVSEFNPSGDGRTHDWETVEMQRQCRNLAVLRDAGARVNLCMGPWTNRTMTEKGAERLAVDLVTHLVHARGFDHIGWLSLFNEPDSIYAPDTALNQTLAARGFGGGLPFADYVEKHRKALGLLHERELDGRVRLVVGDMAWPPARRLEWLGLLRAAFRGAPVSYAFHHYAPDEAAYDDYFVHADARPFRPPPLADEIGAYRRTVGSDAELICWEFNQLGWSSGNYSHFPGVGPRGEDHLGSFSTAVGHTRKVLTMLAHGVDGMSHWCAGDMFYRSGLKNGVMRFGLWRYKWEGWIPRPVYFYYAALMEAFPPGCVMQTLDGLPAGTIGLAAANGDGALTLALLNPGATTRSLAIEIPGPLHRLRIGPEHLPQRPDVLERAKPTDEQPLANWQAMETEGPTHHLSLAPRELTLLRHRRELTPAASSRGSAGGRRAGDPAGRGWRSSP